MVSAPLAPPLEASISDHATAADARQRRGFAPRIRRLHGRIGKAHHQAEGMAFSRSLLDGAATPLQRDGERGVVEVTTSGRWLIRTVAAVLDPAQRRQASGSRLI